MPKPPSPSSSSAIPLTSVGASRSLHPPDQHSPTNSARGSSSDLVHLSKETSRQGTPFTDAGQDHDRDRDGARGEDEDFSPISSTMPSDLRPSLDMMEHKGSHHQPLLSNDKSRQSYDSESHPDYPGSRRGSRFHSGDAEEEAAKATRKRYTYAGAFLLVSLVSFAIQTETAVYIQHNLHWNKAYCML
jgi:hypothetical protein